MAKVELEPGIKAYDLFPGHETVANVSFYVHRDLDLVFLNP